MCKNVNDHVYFAEKYTKIQNYHFTLTTSKNWLSGNQDLHGKLNINIPMLHWVEYASPIGKSYTFGSINFMFLFKKTIIKNTHLLGNFYR